MTVIHLTILLLALFGIKHFICDFMLQYPYMLEQKGTYGARGGIDHAMFHALGTLAIFFLILPWDFESHIFGIILAMFDGVVHYHIDWVKTNINRGLTPADRMFWVWFGADQTLHYLTYIVIIGWTVGAF